MSTLYDLINILPCSLLTVMLFGRYAGIPEGSLLSYALCLIFSSGMILLRNTKKQNRLRSIGIVSVFIAGLLLAAGREYRQLFITEYFWVINLLGLSAAAFVFGIVMDKNIWIRRAAAAALLVYCITGTILGQKISKEVFALVCFVLLVRLAEEVQRKWKKIGCPDIREHITRISPFLLAMCLAVCIMPLPDKPYDWKFAKNIYSAAASCISRIYGYITHPSDDYGQAGFSDKGGFLSGLGENDDEVLRISSDNNNITDLRLIGCISGEFRGQEWAFDTESESCSRMIDTLETCCAVRKFGSSSRSDLLQGANMECETLFYNTRYIFSPAKIRMGFTKERNDGLNEKNGSIISEKRFGYKESYNVSCYVLNYDNPNLEELLNNAEPISKEEWDQAIKSENVFGKSGYSYADYQEYRSEVYSEYCRSYGISGKTAELLNKIRSSSSSRYEAAKMLEAYLRSMEYSTDCGPLPDNVSDTESYLDYFLFTSRKGYCKHFATAFTLMAHELGIPCRYVQGYYVHKGSGDDIIVTQNDAHAWPEVYFDNAGWTAFEPTPGYSVSAGWDTVNNSSYVFNSHDPYSELYSKAEEAPELSEKPESRNSKIDPLIFIIPSLSVITFLILLCVISRSAAKNKYKRMSSHDKIRYLTQRSLRFLSYLGFPMEADETLSEFSDRVMKSDRQDIKDNLGFIPVYETALYSDRQITEADLLSAEKMNAALRGLVKNSKLRYRILLMISGL